MFARDVQGEHQVRPYISTFNTCLKATRNDESSGPFRELLDIPGSSERKRKTGNRKRSVEDIMTLWRKERFSAALLLILFAILLNACAGGQTTQNLVVTEYFLEKAGFQKLDVNETTPKRQALLNSIPRGKISTYQRDGATYHAYTDEAAQRLYIGDETAYQNYLAMTKGRQLCERVEGGSESAKFWSCYDEVQKSGGR